MVNGGINNGGINNGSIVLEVLTMEQYASRMRNLVHVDVGIGIAVPFRHCLVVYVGLPRLQPERERATSSPRLLLDGTLRVRERQSVNDRVRYACVFLFDTRF